MTSIEGTPHQTAALPAEAWEEVRVTMATMLRYMIEPQELYERQAIPVLFKQQLLRWLRPLEAVVRLLLLAMAKTMRVEPIAKRASTKRPSARRAFNPRFLWPRKRKPDAPRKTSLSEPRRFDPVVVESKGIAERMEGVARVIDNPERYAKRLARKLQKIPGEIPAPLEQAPPSALSDTPMRHIWRALHEDVCRLFNVSRPAPRDDSS